MKKIKYYIFSIRWLWRNRNWNNGRQKFKAMERDYIRYVNGVKIF